jgi:hypothetical protein
MNALLKLEFFKSLGFISKETGVEFIKQNPKLQKQIEAKVDEMDEVKYQIIESIKNDVFPKYNDKKELYIIKVKGSRANDLACKKELQKKMLKEEMRAELLKEIKDEELDENKIKLMKKFPKAIPTIDNSSIEKINGLQDLFLQVVDKINSGEIDKDELVVVEKIKNDVEKAIALLMKSTKTLENM